MSFVFNNMKSRLLTLIVFAIFPLNAHAHGGEAVLMIGLGVVVLVGFFIGLITAAYRVRFFRTLLVMAGISAVLFGPILYAVTGGHPYEGEGALAMSAAAGSFVVLCFAVPAAGLIPGWLFVALARWIDRVTTRAVSPYKQNSANITK